MNMKGTVINCFFRIYIYICLYILALYFCNWMYLGKILLTLLIFFCLNNLKNTNLSGMVSLWYDSWCWFLIVPFWNNQWITKWWAKFKLECLLLICTYNNAKLIVICKPRTLNDGGEDSVKYRNRKKHCFLTAAILLFITKNIITW